LKYLDWQPGLKFILIV